VKEGELFVEYQAHHSRKKPAEKVWKRGMVRGTQKKHDVGTSTLARPDELPTQGRMPEEEEPSGYR